MHVAFEKARVEFLGAGDTSKVSGPGLRLKASRKIRQD